MVLLHRVHHNMNSGFQELLHSFRIEVLDRLSEVFDVRKADGDVFVLAFGDKADDATITRRPHPNEFLSIVWS